MSAAARRAAWACAALCALLAVPTIVLVILGTGAATPADDFGETGLGGFSFLVAFMVFAVIGALIVSRAYGNAIGPLFCVIGLIGSVGNFAYQYADYAIYVSPGALPGAGVAACLQNLGPPPAFGLLALALLLFPNGRTASRRWLPAIVLACVGVAAVVFGYTLRPGPVEFPFEAVDNPFGVQGLDSAAETASTLGWPLMAAAVGLGGIAITVRFRRSTGIERQQLKWIALAGAVAGIVLVANAVSFFLSVSGIDTLRIVVVGIVFAGFPIAAGIAILRYRLYDIDIVVNRALVYVALTATLAAAYVGSVLLLQFALSPLTQRSELTVAGSTLAVAALFRPARARIQAWVDRRFYRSRYDAARTLDEFSGRLREQIDLDALGADLRHVVRDTVAPLHVSLWLREAGQ